ncbi:MAG: YegS/Rv2252/BmrU family lipid kinase [Actinomycetota bacterium]|nr:YegS/Rv2252/BmrU family lipid kinase [Actinomycetota bacterium]
MIHVLINQLARRGKGAKAARLIFRCFEELDVDYALVPGETLPEVKHNLQELVDRGAERIIVAGGDGIIHHAIQSIATTETVLGIIPIGTGNDFCRALAIPAGIENAVATSLGEPSPIDLLKVNDRWVASVMTFGFSSDVNVRAEGMRWPTGPSRYTVSTLVSLRSLSSQFVNFSIDDIPFEREISLWNVANTSDFGGGMKIAPAANPFDGIANLTLVSKVGRFELLRFFRRVFSGSHMSHPKVEGLDGKRIVVETAGLGLWADGEFIGESPAVIDLVPDAIRLAGCRDNLKYGN